MTVSFDAQSAADTTGAAATSFSDSTNLTIGNGLKRALTVLVSWSTSTAPTGISISWNGVALTQLIIHSATSGSTEAIYGLLNPDSGTNTLAGSWTGARDFYVCGVSWSGVDQTDNTTAFLTNFGIGTSANATITIASPPVSDAVLAFFAVAATITSVTAGTTPGTQVFLDNTQTSFKSGAVWNPGTGANITLSAANTSAAWVATRVRLVAAPDTVKPREAVLTKLFQWVYAPAFQPYNQSLYSVVSQAPFFQTDWSKPFVLPQLSPQPVVYNLNLFTNPIPFGPYDYSLGAYRVPPLRPDATQPVNPNIFTNPIPFAKFDYPPVEQPPWSPPQAAPYNINVFTNFFPFGPFDWSKPFNLPPERPVPSRGLNINLFTNPIPFAQFDWSHPFVPEPYFPAPIQALNLQLFTNPIPIFNFISQPPTAPSFFAPSTLYNVPLYTVTVVAAPFAQYDWPVAKTPRPQVDVTKPLNPNIFTNPFPFTPIDYSAITPRIPRAPDQVYYNLNVYTVVVTAAPFVPIDYSKSFFPRVLPPDPVSVNIELFTNPIPFFNFDLKGVSKPVGTPDLSVPYNVNLYAITVTYQERGALIMRPYPLRPTPPDVTQSTNINLFTNLIPVLNYDTSITARIKGFSDTTIPYNVNLYGIVTVQVPFAQYDWSVGRFPRLPQVGAQPGNPNLFTNPIPIFNVDTSTTYRIKGFSDTTIPYNVNVYGIVTVQIPFAQYDWPKPFAPRPSLAHAQVTNPSLFTNPIPFAKFDWPRQINVPQVPFDRSLQTNLNLFKNVIPFNQNQYPNPRPIRLGPIPLPPYNQNLYTATVAGTTVHIVKFIGNMGHFMIR